MSYPYKAKALYDYDAVEDTECSMKEGESLTITKKNDDGWLYAILGHGKEGWVPETYVEQTKESSSSKPGRSAPTASKSVAGGGGGGGYAPVSEAPAGSNVCKYCRNDVTGKRFCDGCGSKVVTEEKAPSDVTPGEKICYKCRKPVGGAHGAFISAREFFFHPEHFRCEVCNQELEGQKFLFKDGAFYCTADYYATFNPKCGFCEMAIMDTFIRALGKVWHEDHFVCARCEKPFGGNNTFLELNDKPYCDDCFNLMRAEKCFMCKENIVGPKIEVPFPEGNRKFHQKCYVCGGGDRHALFAGQQVHIHDDKLWCPQHFEELFLERCEVCQQLIRETPVRFAGKPRHPKCFTCNKCKKEITEATSKPKGNIRLCLDCDVQVKQEEKVAAAKMQAAERQKAEARMKQDAEQARLEEEERKKREEDIKRKRKGAQREIFTYKQLRDNDLPDYVDRREKECHLSPDVFNMLFQSSREEFYKMPLWRQQRAKKEVGLF